MKLTIMGALSAFALSASVATAGGLNTADVETEPMGDPYAAAPSSGSLGGTGAIVAGLALIGIAIAVADGS